MALSTQSNFGDPDAAYRLIVEAHRGVSDQQSASLDAALVLILANHIGDLAVLGEALALAKRCMSDDATNEESRSSLRANGSAQSAAR